MPADGGNMGSTGQGRASRDFPGADREMIPGNISTF